MITVSGTYRNGQVILDEPVDWADGSRVLISSKESKPLFQDDEETDRSTRLTFRQENDDLQDPQEIENILRTLESSEPVFDEEEIHQFHEALEWSKQSSIELMRKEWGLDK